MSEAGSVFISYSRYDRDAAFTIKRLLEEHNVRVWLDVISIKVSSQLLQELYNNIDRHETFCLLLSPTSVASPWCLKEIEHAVARDGLRFVPVILRSCKIPADLNNIVGLDAREGLDHDSVRSRLMRALCGDKVIDNSILFDQLQRDLLASNQIIEEGEDGLPEVKRKITAIADEPIRKITLQVELESLPDPGSILELRLKLDLWKGSLSLFMARYQEDHTWPKGLGFEECEYTEFYRKRNPLVDARFRWKDYSQKMPRVGTSNETLAEFYLEFDGHEFHPGGQIRMPANFEVPCLNEQAKHWSTFELFLHSADTPIPTLIDSETDIQIEIFGRVGDREIRLYRSGHTYKQETLLRCPSIIAETNSIWQEVLVHGYDSKDTLRNHSSHSQALRVEVLTALDDLRTEWEKFTFTSVEERRITAHALCSRGGIPHTIHSQYRDAFQRFTAASHLFRSLFKLETPRLWDVLADVDCAEKMIETCLNQTQLNAAVNIGARLKVQLFSLVKDHPQVTDYMRLLADALLLDAKIMGNVKEKEKALLSLDATIKFYHGLYTKQPSQPRRLAYVQALQQGVRNSQHWSLGASPRIEAWASALEKEVGKDTASKLLTIMNPNTLPVWLTPIILSAWPTVPIHNNTLRYALRLPERWVQTPLVRATETQVEHVYWGNASQEAEWLCIDFMGNIQQGNHSNRWIDSVLMLTGLPVVPIHDEKSRGPKRRSFDYLGVMPALAKRLEADEAYGWMGVFQYQRNYVMLGRVYALIVRRGSFGWKIVLSFNTAVLDVMPERMLESNDHVRAGAILGDLRLDGVPRVASPPPDASASATTTDSAAYNVMASTTSKQAKALEQGDQAKQGDQPKQEADQTSRPPNPRAGTPGQSSLRPGALPSFQLRYIYNPHDTYSSVD